jgi:2-polyprenyl-6-methoxyphenol hydroxylase-like FAD-dependent oxidoreductase
MREDRTEVLVVGAGPVGLFTAIQLAEAGIKVKIIDQGGRTTVRSYACALHPSTLKLLGQTGLVAPVLDAGRRVQTVAFYDQASRRAEVKLAQLGGEFPFLLILPQNVLEEILEQRLRKAGSTVDWNHRFEDFIEEEEEITATVDELGGTATGYIVPHWETVVKKQRAVRANFLIGADGYHSVVRQRLGTEYTRVGSREFFAAYEFESDSKGEDELRVVLDPSSTNVLWPLAGNKYRWTFQLLKHEMPAEFPEKERRAVRFEQKLVDEEIRRYVEKVSQQRAPWFKAGVKEVTWCTEVVFEQRVAKQFGRGRCWLAGDAAHQTSPAGVQSMNAGLSESVWLAKGIEEALRQEGGLERLDPYNRTQEQWQRLLGLTGGLKPRSNANAWVAENRARILPCLPASTEDLAALAGQLNLDF